MANVTLNDELSYRLGNKLFSYVAHKNVGEAYVNELYLLRYKVKLDREEGRRADRKDTARIKQLEGQVKEIEMAMKEQKVIFRAMLEGAAAAAPIADGLQGIRISTLWQGALRLVQDGMDAEVALTMALKNPRSYIMAA